MTADPLTLDATRLNGKALLTTESAQRMLDTQKRVAGASLFGGNATHTLIASAVYVAPPRQPLMEMGATLEQIVQTAVEELVSQLHHFGLDGDVLRALQMRASMSGSAPCAAAQRPAFPQSGADQ